MRILIACEFSGVVREAFRALGHDAWSCDLLPTELIGKHLQCDALEAARCQHWDLMIAFPPCTHLCVSGARWFASGHKDKQLREDALSFVQRLMNAPIKHIALENPIGAISSRIRKPDQIIRPCMFGDDSRKATCLWLKNLPPLKPTNEIVASVHTSKSGRKWDKWFFDSSLISDLKARSTFRSRTFPGIAQAMAAQWTKHLSQ